MSIKPLFVPLQILTLVENSTVLHHVRQSCTIAIQGQDTQMDLLLLDMINFNIILGMD